MQLMKKSKIMKNKNKSLVKRENVSLGELKESKNFQSEMI